jgi:uncharacterized membrane-anchored protein YhcB (DUF1043 family)
MNLLYSIAIVVGVLLGCLLICIKCDERTNKLEEKIDHIHNDLMEIYKRGQK